MSDLIDRQAVINTVHKIIYGFISEEDGVMTDTEKTLLSVNKAICNELAKLPSAEKRTNKHTETHECDLISRQAAIDLLDKIPVREFKKSDDGLIDALISVGQVYMALKHLPSAEPEIIRCKDCKWFYKNNWCVRYLKPFMADDFCSYAERRTDETD